MYAATTRISNMGDRLPLRALRTHSNSSGYEADMEWRDSQKVLLPHPSAEDSFSRAMAIPNFSRVLSKNQGQGPTLEPSQLQLDLPTMRKSPCKSQGIKRWNGETRTYNNWDGLRRDAELWDMTGDCHVHLYGKGNSRRGPSFRVHSQTISDAACSNLFAKFGSMSSTSSSDGSTSPLDSGYSSSSCLDATGEVYVPAPVHAKGDEAFNWHITTRNLFAWMHDKPIVGPTLGKAMVKLLERIEFVRPHHLDNLQDCLDYADRMGYTDFSHSPDYAIAFLHFAEHFQLRSLWIDAFVHCVGMNDNLCLSHEFESTSQVTKALITRASLEMDLHLGRITRALSNFLEDELSASNLGLSPAARVHLDHFRSFLHSFYVAKFGYWPPPEGVTFSKDLLQSMYNEFHNLYEHLADVESSELLQHSSKAASGGLCVLQNVNAFNSKHKYEPLPHPLPLLPQCASTEGKVSSQRGLRALKLGTKAAKNVKLMSARVALITATNNNAIPEVSECPLVRAYDEFEQECLTNPEAKLSMVDARKVRWIMVYSTLQMLVSVTKAPREVRDSWSPNYQMCCLVTDVPPWREQDRSTRVSTPSLLRSISPVDFAELSGSDVSEAEGSSPPVSIHPDCESGDYFTHKTQHERNASGSSLTPAPLRISIPTTTLSRNPSLRSLQRVFSRRTRSPSTLHAQPFDQIHGQGYGNGQNSVSFTSSPLAAGEEEDTTTLPSSAPTEPFSHLLMPQISNTNGRRTPTLDALMLQGLCELEGAPAQTSPSFDSDLRSSGSIHSTSSSTAPSSSSDHDAFSTGMRSSNASWASSSSPTSTTSPSLPVSPIQHKRFSWQRPQSPQMSLLSQQAYLHKRDISSATVFPDTPVQAADCHSITGYSGRGDEARALTSDFVQGADVYDHAAVAVAHESSVDIHDAVRLLA